MKKAKAPMKRQQLSVKGKGKRKLDDKDSKIKRERRRTEQEGMLRERSEFGFEYWDQGLICKGERKNKGNK
jgi:hypothetical protein